MRWALILIAGVLLTAASQPPTPGPPKHGQEPKSDTAATNNPPDYGQRGTDQSPLIVEMKGTVETQSKAAENPDKALQKLFSERWIDTPDGVTAIFTGLSAFIFVLQLIAFSLQAHYARKTIKTAEQAVAETRRIGEAQVRAYVSVAEVELQFIRMGLDSQPVVEISLKNSGSSPARRLGWNVTVRYLAGKKRRSKSLIDPIVIEKWARTHDISASDTIKDRAMLSEMFINKFAQGVSGLGIILHLRVAFIYVDVFDREIVEEAYFSGLAQRRIPQEGQNEWVAVIGPMARPRDWDELDSE